MAVKVTLKDNSKIILKTMEGNVEAALAAMGTKAVNLILWQMRQGYGKPIRQTGNLQRDVQYEVMPKFFGGGVVRAGNTLDYSGHVHDGTSRMPGRPYITDGLTGEGHAKQLRSVAEEALVKGF